MGSRCEAQLERLVLVARLQARCSDAEPASRWFGWLRSVSWPRASCTRQCRVDTVICTRRGRLCLPTRFQRGLDDVGRHRRSASFAPLNRLGRRSIGAYLGWLRR